MTAKHSFLSHFHLFFIIPLLILVSSPILISSQYWTTYGPHIMNPHVWNIQPNLTKTYNYSYPVINLAGTFTMIGTYAADANFQTGAFQFYIDMINSRGGVTVAGQPYYLSLTWASDDSSMDFLNLLWTDIVQNNTFTSFIGPATDVQLQAVLPLVKTTNKVIMSAIDQNPADYLTGYQYLYNSIATSDITAEPGMDRINQRAQLYYNQVQSGQVQAIDSSPLSPFGILTACLFWENDAQPIASCGGVRSWINQTNQLRLNAGAMAGDLIQIVLDYEWTIPSTTIDTELYTSSFAQCPPMTDLIVVCGETAQTPNYTVALSASRVRPKAIYTTTLFINYDPTQPQQVMATGGWISFLANDPTRPVTATLPGSLFKTTAQLSSDFTQYSGVAFSTTYGAMVKIMELYVVAATSALSWSSTDLRASMIAINGSSAWGHVQIDPITGVNSGQSMYLAQVLPSGAYNYFENTYANYLNIPSITYPYNWPWLGIVMPGDVINQSQNSTTILIALVLCVLGCWVAMILVEQAVFIRRRGGWYQFWLLLVAVSLGGAGIWCSLWMQSAALSVTKPGDPSPLDIAFSFDVALLAILPAIILVFIGVLIMIYDVENNKRKESTEAVEARRIEREQAKEKKKKAALDFKAHLFHLFSCISWRLILGSVFIIIGIILTRVTLWYGWVQDSTWSTAAWAWIVTIIIHCVLVPSAMLQFFHGLRHRFVAVFLLSASVICDYQIHVTAMKFVWTPTATFTPSDLYTLNLSATAVNLITGIISAGTCFGFIGLQFSRMQLSRNGLSVLVAKLEQVIHNERKATMAAHAHIAKLSQSADNLVKIIEFINIVRPIAREYAYAMAVQASAASFESLVQSNSDGVRRGTKILNEDTVQAVSVNGDDKPTGWMIKTSAAEPSTATSTTDKEQISENNNNNNNDPPSKAATSERSAQSNMMVAPAPVRSRGSIAERRESAEAGILNQSENGTSGAALVDGARLKQYETNIHELLVSLSQHLDSTVCALPNTTTDIVEKLVRTEFSLTQPLFGKSSITPPTLKQLLTHPVCIEFLKDELGRLMSGENLSFYLHVLRYKRFNNAQLRKQIAIGIYDTFIKQSADFQININTRQRETIAALIKKDSYPGDLFRDAEAEVLVLMETNLMKSYVKTLDYRVCAWIYHSLDMSQLINLTPSELSANRKGAAMGSMKDSSHFVSQQLAERTVIHSHSAPSAKEKY